MIPGIFHGLQGVQTGFTRLLTGISEALPDRTLVGLKAQISVLDGACRVLTPWRGEGRGWEGTAVRLQSELNRAEQALARRHAAALFSNALLSRLVFLTPFGVRDANLNHYEDVLRVIDQEGMGGYVDLLTAAINQHWAPIIMWELLRGRYVLSPHDYDDIDNCTGPSVAIVVGLLAAIESDSHVEKRFRVRWNEFSPQYPLDEVRERIDSVAVRYRKESRLQSLL
jgi:hypothetical protein